MGSEVSASFGIRVRKGFFDEQNTGNGTGGAERSLNLDIGLLMGAVSLTFWI